MFKKTKPGNNYFIINIDEPYAEDIYRVLKAGQEKKGEWPEGDITFEEWKDRTFFFDISEHPLFGIDIVCKRCGESLTKDDSLDYHRCGKCVSWGWGPSVLFARDPDRELGD